MEKYNIDQSLSRNVDRSFDDHTDRQQENDRAHSGMIKKSELTFDNLPGVFHKTNDN
jgi:hypothetical protein